MHITRTYGKEKAILREKETGLYEKVSEAQLNLERDPQSIAYQATLAMAEVELKEFLAIKTDWMMDIERQKWLMADSQCSAALAATFK